MHSEYTHTPSDTWFRFNLLMYAEIDRSGADPNRIRIGLFFRSPPLRFPCIVLSSACCHVPSPLLCALEFVVVVLFSIGSPGCLAVLQPLDVLLASMHRNRPARRCSAFSLTRRSAVLPNSNSGKTDVIFSEIVCQPNPPSPQPNNPERHHNNEPRSGL